MLSVEHISLRLQDFQLRDITFSVAQGEYCVLLGVSGVGKTVVLEMLAGLLRPDQGVIRFAGKDLTRASIEARRFGLVYQDHALFPHLNVEANIGYALHRLSRSARRERVFQFAEEVGATHLLSRLPGTLSLGEAQRVALARALATDPLLLLLDEPLASLDMTSRASIRALLRRLNRAGRTVIHVTHDFEEAIALASRVVVLENGCIVQEGSPDEVFHHPRSVFIAHFSGVRNALPGCVIAVGEEVVFESGTMKIQAADEASLGAGLLLLRAEDITLSKAPPDGSARNCFLGRVLDIETAPHSVDVEVDVGCRLVARITKASVTALELAPNKQVWVSWKSTAGRVIN